MREKITQAAGRAAVTTAVTATARADVHVLCRAAALATAVSSAVSGQTLDLARDCVYHLTTALPAITGNLLIQGHHATHRQRGGHRQFALHDAHRDRRRLHREPGADGGAIYNGGATMTVSRCRDHPDNCAPAGSVPHCTDPAGSIRR